MRKRIPFNTAEVISRAQTEIICALLRLIPWENTIPINRMHIFLNTDSYLADGYLIESVRLVEDGHHVQMTFRPIDYGKLDESGLSIRQIDEKKHLHLFEKEPQTCILHPSAEDENLLPLLDIIYTEAERAVEAKNRMSS